MTTITASSISVDLTMLALGAFGVAAVLFHFRKRALRRQTSVKRFPANAAPT